jgi:hypothetical protein
MGQAPGNISLHITVMRRIRRILERKREARKWLGKWDAMHDRFVKEQAELQASKPEGLR